MERLKKTKARFEGLNAKIFISTLLIFWSLVPSTATPQTLLPPLLLEEAQKLTASDAQSSHQFGFSVAVSGDTAVVGAFRDHDKAGQSGAAYVFEKNLDSAENWGEVAKLKAADAEIDDHFGYSVSINKNTIVVGAYLNDDACPEDVGCNSGSVYIFERDQGGPNNWGEVKKLTASDAASGDFFGISVSISNDTIVVGARGDDHAGLGSGSAYIFERSKAGTLWGEAKKITALDAISGAHFGGSASLNEDTLVIGAVQAGAAYVFGRNRDGEESWGQIEKVTASDASSIDRFGVSVSVSGDTLVVGSDLTDEACSVNPPGTNCDSGAVYIFERNLGGPENWGELSKLTASDPSFFARFGNSVSISSNIVVVGAFQDDDGNTASGAAYIFERNFGGLGNWGEVEKLQAPDREDGDEFGISVSIDGGSAIVGAHLGHDEVCCSGGAAYVFSPGDLLSRIFADDFESGNTSVWSSVVDD